MRPLIFALALMAAVLASCEKGAVTEKPKAAAPQAAPAQAKVQYSGTIYVAGMGGHIARAEVAISPADQEQPIKVNDLGMIPLGTKDTHPTHDVRIDAHDRTRMYFSTYKPDSTVKGRFVHMGTVDLRTDTVTSDKLVELDKRAVTSKDVYCASGQTRKSYIPLTMTEEAYIDVVDKSDMNLKHRVFLDYRIDEAKFYHGTNTPDMKQMYVAVNLVNNGVPNGRIDVMLLDMDALEAGRASTTVKAMITGEPGKTLTFRQSFTPDGRYMLQSGNDRFYLLDGQTLKLLDEEMMQHGGSHGAMSTPDGKYAVITLRSPTGDKRIVDGTILLYDIENRRAVGKPTSICGACHSGAGVTGSVSLCGGDVNWRI